MHFLARPMSRVANFSMVSGAKPGRGSKLAKRVRREVKKDVRKAVRATANRSSLRGIVQGAAAATTKAFGGRRKRRTARGGGMSMAGFDALKPHHVSLPRAVGPSVVRTTSEVCN